MFFDAVDETKLFVDILVNNVGVFAVQDFFTTSETVSFQCLVIYVSTLSSHAYVVYTGDEDWQDYHDKNIMTTVRFCRRYLKAMLEHNSGRIINVSRYAGEP